jgi:hypothetical protein
MLPARFRATKTDRRLDLIIYDLCCEAEHRFEGWFVSPQAFEQQLADGLIECPLCGNKEVRRVVSPLHLASEKKSGVEQAQVATKSPRPLFNPEEAIAFYSRAVQSLLKDSEDVGAGFAEEARRIHYEEIPARTIHGQASDEDFEELKDEGIDVMKLLVFRNQDDLN